MKQGNINMNIGYQGEVKIFITSSNGKKEVFAYNSGHKPLWNILAKAITGYDVSDSIPRYLDLVYSDSKVSLLFKRLPFTGVVWGDSVEKSETSTSALFTATLLNEHKNNSLCSGSVELRMLNANNEILASISSDSSINDIYNSVVPGVDAVIEWKLIFKNVGQK